MFLKSTRVILPYNKRGLTRQATQFHNGSMIHKHFFQWLFILGIIFIGGCDFMSSSDPIVITATPESNPQVIYVTATPDFTPIPPPVATPMLPPQDAFTVAEQALFNGNFAFAVQTYQGILAQDFVDSELRASAYYSLGKAALREGLFDQAVFALNSFIQEYPQDSRLAHAYFMRGEAYLGSSIFELAIADFQQYLQLRAGVIDSYAYERIGDAYLGLGQPDLAFENYLNAANTTRSSGPLAVLRERIATTYINQGRYDLAIGQYDAILSFAQNNGYRANIELKAAEAELNAGLTSNAYARMQAMLTIYPETAATYQAMIQLLNAGFTVENLTRARLSFANEDYGDAITAITNYHAETGTTTPETMLILGRSYRALGNFDAATTTFQTLRLQNVADPSIYGEAWLEEGRTYFQAGNYLNAVNHYSQLATDLPTNPYAGEGLWRAAYIYTTYLGDNERAFATFDILARNYPGNEWAESGLLIASALAVNTGQIGKAQNFYTLLANTGSGDNKALAFLWLGKLYTSQGQTELARQSYQGAAQASPGSYYSLRAEDLLTGREPFTPPDSYRFTFDEGTEIAIAEQWLRDTFGIQQTGVLYPLADNLANDPHMIRGSELWELAAYDDARVEFDTLREQYENDPLATYQLAHYFAQIGHYRTSIEAAATLIIMAGVSTYNAPSYIARLRYPAHYADLVLPFTQEYNLNPLLVYSLIRQESLFQSFATSFAYAQGLMQIIPDTGEWVAAQLEWENYQNSDLYRPYVSIQFGTYYLSWVLDYLGGVPYAALAGYNGGPTNALNWLEIAGKDIDRFVQAITFDETRTYVTNIYLQYDVYRHLYGVDNP